MNSQEAKKAKRRKSRLSTAKSTVSSAVPQSKPSEVSAEENGDAERIARLMDAPDDSEDIIPPFNRGPNPYLDREKCLLCGIDRTDPVHPCNENTAPDSAENRSDIEGHAFAQLPLWVCPPCRQAADGDMGRKMDLKSVAEIPMPAIGLNPGQMCLPHATIPATSISPVKVHDVNLEAPSLSLFGDINLTAASEPVLPNGTLCTCESCTERRQIAAEHDRETLELQSCWNDLRSLVRALYSQEKLELTEEESTSFCDMVARLCSRDAHQLFLRLESQVREFVIEKKVNLLKKLSAGYGTPPEAREVMSTLLNEYNQLCAVSRLVSEHLTDLKDHLERFNVTWELHNKHLYHSIVFSDPAIFGSLDAVCEQLRNGALSKDSYTEDTYPKLMKSFIDFRNEMSVILVIWHDCQQLIERYNEEQTALKVKQKWLKEDWEFFKAQRKLLEQQVLKNNPKASSMSHSMEAQFTETMRNMLTGQKPTAEECHCPRCNRKRCPCDECTITHMITCGIINPEALETNGTHHTFNFPHDSNRYIIDVTPPSMSSTTSSSASSSPVPVSPQKVAAQLSACNESLRNAEAPEEDSNQNDEAAEDEEVDEEDEDNEEDDDEEDVEDEEEDEEEEEDDEEDDEEELEDEGEADGDDEEEDEVSQDQKDFDQMLASGKLGMPLAPVGSHIDAVQLVENLKLWDREQPEEPLELSTQDFPVAPCACHHCVLQPQPETQVGTEETGCQCHVCLQQQGQTVSTALPACLPLPPRPAQLHLYPHIHGTLPPPAHSHPHLHMTHSHTPHAAHSHPQHTARSLLQPQLYDLHGVRSQRLPLKLDFEDPDGIQDHLYHAYGDWDNTYNPPLLLPSAHRFSSGLSSDLLPPPPSAETPFSMETPSSVVAASHAMLAASSSMAAASTASAFKAVAGFSTGIPPAFQPPVDPPPQDLSTASSQPAISSDPSAKVSTTPASLSSLPISFAPAVSQPSLLPHSPPCTRPPPVGGNAPTQPTGKEQRTYAQPCKKYSLTPPASGLQMTGKLGVPPPPPPSSHNHVNVPVCSNGLQAAANKLGAAAKNQRPGVPAGQTSHACSHAQHLVHTSGQDSHADSQGGAIGTCPSAASLPTTINNVSVGTSTLCADPDCQQHHDDNCDSIDDSCSEKSSSTSTSNNQKEGKYCDCCYCEFFGHGTPPVAQTSKNYAEMRERLRRRLKQRNEAKQEGGSNETQAGSRKDPLEIKGLEELLKFINGNEADGVHTGGKTESQQMSSKAAKRARQKQRKAEEKARQEEEERLKHIRELASQKAAAEKAAVAEKEGSAGSVGGQKKKGKHKEGKGPKEKAVPAQSEADAKPVPQSQLVDQPKASKTKQRLKDGSQPTACELPAPVRPSEPVTGKKISAVKQEVPSAVPNRTQKEVPQQTSSAAARMPVSMNKPAAHVPLPVTPPPTVPRSQPVSVSPVVRSPLPAPVSTQAFLGGQPNSPTAKKAKRRLDAAQQAGARRRLEAQQQVQQQLHEMEERARQQQIIRQLQQQQQQKQQQQQQQQLQLQQQKSQLPQPKPPQQQQQKQPQLQPKQAPPLKQAQAPKQQQQQKQQSPAPQLFKASANGVRGAQMLEAPAPKLQNGTPLMHKSPPPTALQVPNSVAVSHVTTIQTGANGLAAAAVTLSPENRARIASMAERTRAENQEQAEQAKNAKSKKNKKKNKGNEVSKGVDEVFMPRSESDLENGEIDDFERELEEFKRFCFDAPSTPKAKPKIQVNVNLKDLYLKKKTGLSCS